MQDLEACNGSQRNPVFRHQLVQARGGARDGNAGQHTPKPGIGGAQHQRMKRMVAACRIVVPQVGAAAQALGQAMAILAPKGLGQAALRLAGFTAGHQVARFARRTIFVEAQQRRGTRSRSTVDILDPGKVVQMPVLARHDKTCWDGDGLVRTIAVLVDVAALGAEAARLGQLEQPAVDGCQQATGRADHPPREGGDRDADRRHLAEWIPGVGALVADGRREELLHLAQRTIVPHRGKQPLFDDLAHGAGLHRPVVKPRDDDREVRQVDDGAHPIGVEQLAGANLADDGFFGRVHGVAASSLGVRCDRHVAGQPSLTVGVLRGGSRQA